MELSIFIKAIIIGFSISIPVGPVGLLCITHSLNRGRLAGFISGFGATIADTLMVTVVGVGATAVTGFFIKHNFWIGLIGGLILFVVALSMLLKKQDENDFLKNSTNVSRGLISDFLLSFFLTITNPLNIIFSAAIFIKLFTMTNGTMYQISITVLGVFFGSALWWFMLGTAAGSFQNHITHKKIFMINKIAGYIFLLLAVWFIIQSFV